MYDYIMIDNEQGFMDKEEVEALNEDYNDILKRLERLEELEKENQELEVDKKMLKTLHEEVRTTANFYMSKYEKLEKALEILKNKRVDLGIFMNCKTLEEYNNAIEYTYKSISGNYKLTQEEYNLLKEVFGE